MLSHECNTIYQYLFFNIILLIFKDLLKKGFFFAKCVEIGIMFMIDLYSCMKCKASYE